MFDNGVRKKCKKLGILEDILFMKKNKKLS